MSDLYIRAPGLFAVALLACSSAEKPAQLPAHGPASSMFTFAQLSDAFQKARAPRNADLTGVWAEIRSIQTRQYLEGRDGPDQVRYDSTGLKHENDPRRSFSWTLTFAKIPPAKYAVTQRMGAQPSAPEPVALDSSGTFRFHPDFEADEAIEYTCHVMQVGRFICLDLEHTGDGVEFKQISTMVPPPPPPFCPLTEMTECGGATTRAGALRILADARACYHLLYPLTHVPASAEGTDTWLVLGADSLPPIGTWQYAAVFDDSTVRVGAWRRTAHSSSLAKTPLMDRPPQRDSLDLRLTVSGTNVRGVLGYGDAALEGTLFAEETPYSWGVEGTRRECPSPRDLK